MKTLTTTLFLFCVLFVQAQSELNIKANIFYQDKAFDVTNDSPFKDAELELLKEVNLAYSFNLGYSYFLNDHNGIGLVVGYSINNVDYKEPIMLITPANEVIGESVGQEAHFYTIAVAYTYRTKKDNKSNVWFDLGFSIGSLQKAIYRRNITLYDEPSQQNFNGIDQEHDGYYYLGIEPSIVWSLGRNRAGRGIDLSLGLPAQLLNNRVTGTTYLAGVGVEFSFIL